MSQDDDIKKLASEHMTEGRLEPLRYGFVNAIEVENASIEPVIPSGVVGLADAEWPPPAIAAHFDRGSKDVAEVAWLVANMCERAIKPHLGLEIHTRIEPYPEKHLAKHPNGVTIWVKFVCAN